MSIATNDRPGSPSRFRAPAPHEPTTACERVYLSVRSDILDGTHEPGAKLSEVALGRRLHASRTPVREALRLLARDGLVRISPNRGARVMRWDVDDLDALFSLRTMLESHGAGRAAIHRTPAQLDDIRDLVAQMDTLGPVLDEKLVMERARLDDELHRTIMLAARSPHLVASLHPLIHMSLITDTFRVYSAAATARSQQQHRDLLMAIEEKNAELARAVMSAHFLCAYQEVQRDSRASPGVD